MFYIYGTLYPYNRVPLTAPYRHHRENITSSFSNTDLVDNNAKTSFFLSCVSRPIVYFVVVLLGVPAWRLMRRRASGILLRSGLVGLLVITRTVLIFDRTTYFFFSRGMPVLFVPLPFLFLFSCWASDQRCQGRRDTRQRLVVGSELLLFPPPVTPPARPFARTTQPCN